MKCEELSEIFKKNDLTFFTGVPDSIFKDWMKFLADGNGLTNIIACNECEATAIASGYHLATNKVGIVYMQNSGLGKCVNPLTSLISKEAYAIPTLLMIGWRGEPEKKDEPQHKMMGRIMLPLLDTLEIPYQILPNDIKQAEQVIKEMKELAEQKNYASAIIIKKDTLEEYVAQTFVKTNYEMSREDAIKLIVDNMDGEEVIVSTTGKTSRELFEYRVARQEIPRDFYTVGSMGCSASIANSIALQKPEKKIFIFDGDGAVLMQMGALSTIGHYKAKNLYHVIFDNTCHDSTGGQPTVSSTVDFKQIALSCGYRNAIKIETKDALIKTVKETKEKQGPNLFIVKVNKGARQDLGRPTTTPIENKEAFMQFLQK